MFCTKNTIICLVLEVATTGGAPSLGRFQYINKMASRDTPIKVSNEEEDKLVGARPQNPKEVRSCHEKVNVVFETFGELG